ncbi:hypothetical protein ACF0H5_024033 [Mactra antiquata]
MKDREAENQPHINDPGIVEMSMVPGDTLKDDDDVIKDHVTTVEDDLRPDDILQQLGGCGTFQILLAVVIQSMKLVVAWGMGSNSFFAFVPKWRCADIPIAQNYTSGYENETLLCLHDNNATRDYWNEQCELPSGEKCQHFEFEKSIHTIVSEFDLVCDKSWVTATIISLQMIGMMVGSFIVGHLSDIFGRKIPFISSMAILVVFHLVCYFSVNWIMFAVGRFFVGVGSAFFLSIYCIMQGEYMLSKWRSTVISFPSWAIEMCLFTLVAWLLHDWSWMTLLIILGSFLYMATWFFIPESFRWLVARDRFKEAQNVVKQLEKCNRRTAPDFDKIVRAFTDDSQPESENYSALILFRNRSLLRITLPLITGWLSLGLISYGIGFGVKKFSGNFFLNLFLFSILSIPSKSITIYLQNVIGRKYTIVLSFCVCFIGGCVVGVIQYIDTPYKGGLGNGFALAASAGVDAAWGPMQTLTVELYPTVARTTGFGFLSVLARLGAVIGPQFVYLEDYVPGLLYFVSAGMAGMSILCVLCLPETMNTTLIDKLTDDQEKQRRHE